jgi:hypothetical protein
MYRIDHSLIPVLLTTETFSKDICKAAYFLSFPGYAPSHRSTYVIDRRKLKVCGSTRIVVFLQMAATISSFLRARALSAHRWRDSRDISMC